MTEYIARIPWPLSCAFVVLTVGFLMWLSLSLKITRKQIAHNNEEIEPGRLWWSGWWLSAVIVWTAVFTLLSHLVDDGPHPQVWRLDFVDIVIFPIISIPCTFFVILWWLIQVQVPTRKRIAAFREKQRPKPDTHGKAGVATDDDLAKAGLTGRQPGEGIRLGYDESGNVIRYCGGAHLILVAPTRSGKFTNVLSHALSEYRGSVIVIDPKGQIAAVTKKRREQLGEVVVLSPFDEGLPPGLPQLLGPTKSYNPMDLLNSKSSGFEVACDSMAETLIAEDKESTNAGYFTGNARRAVAGIIMELKLHYPSEEQNLVRVCEIMCTDELFTFSRMARDFRDASPFVMERLSQFMGDEKQRQADDLQSIIRTAQGQLGFVSSTAMRNVLQRSDFCFDDLKRRPITVFLVLPSKFLSPCRKWFRLVIGSAVEEIISTQRGRVPVLAIMDEFAQLGRVPVIETAMSEAAGHGLQLWPILQNIPQLEGLYGPSWKTFMSGAQIQQYFRPNEDATADYISKNAGQRTVETRSQSYDSYGEKTGSGTGETGQPVYDAHPVMGLDDDKCLMFARGMVKNIIAARRRPYWKDEEVRRHCSSDPYHQTAI